MFPHAATNPVGIRKQREYTVPPHRLYNHSGAGNAESAANGVRAKSPGQNKKTMGKHRDEPQVTTIIQEPVTQRAHHTTDYESPFLLYAKGFCSTCFDSVILP